MNDTLFYIIVAVVILHFVAGFGYLIYKLSGPVSEEVEEEKRAEL